MALSVQLGLLLALATAFASILGFLLKARGAVESPDVDWRRPVRSSLVLFRSRTYAIGMGVAMASWGLHVGALSLAPISLVQTVIAGGLVLLTVAADRLFGQDVTRREWIGVALTAAGLAVLAATMSGTGHDSHNDYEGATLLAYAGTLTVIGLAAAGAGWHRRPILVAVSAGLLWGASDTTIKAASGTAGMTLLGLCAVIGALSLVGLLVSTRSLQRGRAVPVIAATSAAANVVTIAAGLAVFGEPMPDDALGVAVRVLAFALVIVAASLTPPPGARAARAPAAGPTLPAGMPAAEGDAA
jgi:multidrug transporter EmrE-like cation transporter